RFLDHRLVESCRRRSTRPSCDPSRPTKLAHGSSLSHTRLPLQDDPLSPRYAGAHPTWVLRPPQGSEAAAKSLRSLFREQCLCGSPVVLWRFCSLREQYCRPQSQRARDSPVAPFLTHDDSARPSTIADPIGTGGANPRRRDVVHVAVCDR